MDTDEVRGLAPRSPPPGVRRLVCVMRAAMYEDNAKSPNLAPAEWPNIDNRTSTSPSMVPQTMLSPILTPSPPPCRSPDKVGKRPSVGGLRRKLYRTVHEAELQQESLRENPAEYYKRLDSELEEQEEQVSPCTPLPPLWTTSSAGTPDSPDWDGD
eukprot:Hpha_TRINITY_DN8406_c0_g1::TRINITY_DN8406_c0_g1_i1::g.34672::m.34672